MAVRFEWDEAKREANLAKHGVDLIDAAAIFDGATVSEPDLRFDYGETRWRTTGVLNGRVHVVIHTERNGVIRLISARKGGRRDTKRYQASLA